MNELRPADAPSKARRSGVAACLVVAAFVAVFLWEAFVGRTFVMRDSVNDFVPWRRLAAQAAADGHLPLWNSWSRFGQPFVANPQSGVFYPPHLFFDVLPVEIAFPLSLALHLFIGAAGLYALSRRLGAATEAALFGGVVFAFGTYFVSNLEFMSVMDTLAWSPLSILLACCAGDAWTAHRSVRRALPPVVWLALVLALQLVVGQVQVLGFTSLAALVLGVAVALSEGRRGAAVATVVAFGGAALLAVGLALVQILPTLELVPHSIRAGGVDPGLDFASMPPRHLVTLLLPFAFGRPGPNTWWQATLFEFWLGALHIGLPALVVVSAAALPRVGAGPRRAIAAVCAALVVAGIAVAMGKYTPVYGFLDALPGAGKVRWPAKGLQLAALGLALLAGIGFDGLLRRREHATGRVDAATAKLLVAWSAVAGIVLLAGTSGRALFAWLAGGTLPEKAGDAAFQIADLQRSVAFLALGVAGAAALAFRRVPRRIGAAALLVASFANLHLVARDIHWVGDVSLLTLPAVAPGVDGSGAMPERVHTSYSRTCQLYGVRDPWPFRLVTSVLANETSLPYGVFKTYGGDALQIQRTFDAVALLVALPAQQADRLGDILAITHRISGPPFEELAATPDAAIPQPIARPSALPRAYLVERWETVATRVAALERMLAPDFDARSIAIEDPTSGAPPLPSPPPLAHAEPAGSVVAVKYGWDKVDVDVATKRPALLVLCDTWFPGWIARVDGAEVPIRRVNTIFRGVPLPAGARRVEFTYEPASFRHGAIGSSVALLVAGVALFLGRRGERISTRDPSRARP